MQVEFHGAVRTVTGSQHIVVANGKRILFDCGLFQGKRDESYGRNKNFPFDPSQIDVVILSHAHMDHSGNIPNLVKSGFKGSIYATRPTVDLCRVLLKDSAFLQQRDIEYVNKIKAAKGEPLFKPIYTIEDVEACLDMFVGVEYDRPFSVGPGIRAIFRDAGHILGSAGIQLEIEENGKHLRFGFSGDIGRPDMPLTNDPNQMGDMDGIIMETTYGNRIHDAYGDTEEKLAQLVNDVARTGGRILIPAFAVGRTQLLIYILHKLYNENRIPEIPIFVDSPMSNQVTEVYKNYLDELDRETQRVFIQNAEDPFRFHRLRYVETVGESKELMKLTYPHIIISASGMAEGGRILHHMENAIGDRKTTLLFVGYAAEHTLARKIMDGDRKVKIFGIPYEVKCDIKVIDAFSAHADRHELLHYLNTNSPEKLKHIFLVHGEIDQMESFRNALRSKGYHNVHIPEEGEMYEISGR